MDVARRVLLAATARADALAAGDADRLRQLLHPEFIWTSHRGERFNRDDYVHSNIGGRNRWSGQTLQDPAVTVVGDVAVLRCTVVDTVDTGSGSTGDDELAHVIHIDEGTPWATFGKGPRCHTLSYRGPTRED